MGRRAWFEAGRFEIENDKLGIGNRPLESAMDGGVPTITRRVIHKMRISTDRGMQKTSIKLEPPIGPKARTRPGREEQVQELGRTDPSGSRGHIVVEFLAHGREHPAIVRLVSPLGWL